MKLALEMFSYLSVSLFFITGELSDSIKSGNCSYEGKLWHTTLLLFYEVSFFEGTQTKARFGVCHCNNNVKES